MKGRLLLNEKLDRYTSWRTGGLADRLYFPTDKQDLSDFVQSLNSNEPLFWLGLGSNLLIRDGGIRGTVVSLRGCLEKITKIDEQTLCVEAGARCGKVARFSEKQDMTDAEFLAGIPGTMGGALKMNAGAFGKETWQLVQQVESITQSGKIIKRDPAEYEISYRQVNGPMDEWFISMTLQLTKSVSTDGRNKIREMMLRRSTTQPINKPSCGSVFKNPPGDYAARLIEVSGLKGHRIGDACVSNMHANFIVNEGKATSAEIEQLIDLVIEEVDKKQGVRLQREVQIVGERG
ncbi:MAG: UDP-N-acetylmuramate dehydrogenase [Methylococcaceae bacterium]